MPTLSEKNNSLSSTSIEQLTIIEQYFAEMVKEGLQELKLDEEYIKKLVNSAQDSTQNFRSISRKFFPLFQNLKNNVIVDPNLYFAIMIRSIYLLSQFSKFQYEDQNIVINTPLNWVRDQKIKNKPRFKNIELDNLVNIIKKTIDRIDDITKKVSTSSKINVQEINLNSNYYDLFTVTQFYNFAKQLPSLMGVYLLLIIVTKPQSLLLEIDKNINLIIDLICDINLFINPLAYNLIHEVQIIANYRKTPVSKLNTIRSLIIEYALPKYLIDMLLIDINTAPSNWLNLLAVYYPEIDPYLREGSVEYLNKIRNRL